MNYVKSKQRVADHGEVFTPAWMVEAMLDPVKGEAERIDSRFLEPACGSGNFLVRILQRKLAAVELKFAKSDFAKRHYALLALMCTYGIELLADNIAECRANMLEILADYLNIDESHDIYRAAFYVLSQLQDVITKLEPELFLAVTGLTVKDFHLLVRLKVFNTEQMNQAVFAFRRYEDASLRYTGIESHPGLTHYGLYDTVVARE